SFLPTELSELVPISTSLELEQVDYSATDNLTSSVDADLSESVPISTSLEPGQVDYRATDTLTGGVDADLKRISTSVYFFGV
ncbi:SpoIIE-like phosphatase domain protein, partial [Trifolium pratense]